MAEQEKLRVHIGDTDWDLAMNIIHAVDHLSRKWEKDHPGKRYGINLAPAGEGKVEIIFVGWPDV